MPLAEEVASDEDADVFAAAEEAGGEDVTAEEASLLLAAEGATLGGVAEEAGTLEVTLGAFLPALVEDLTEDDFPDFIEPDFAAAEDPDFMEPDFAAALEESTLLPASEEAGEVLERSVEVPTRVGVLLRAEPGADSPPLTKLLAVSPGGGPAASGPPAPAPTPAAV